VAAHEFTENENLRKHALAVEAAVRGYRGCGRRRRSLGRRRLLHDFDYDRYPT